MPIHRKILTLLTQRERRGLMVLLGLMVIGMVLETLSIGLVVPALAVLIQSDIGASYPRLKPVLDALGHPNQAQLISAGMIALVVIYSVKVLFLGLLAWRQTRFAFGVQVHLSQRLFALYLRQPYTFHLQRNSAQLLRNVSAEVGMFTAVLTQSMILCTEALVLVGVATLLLFIEPAGALIVGAVLGTATWGFQRVTRGRIARWGSARQRHERLRIQHLQQGIGGVKEVKLLGREQDFLSQYNEHAAKSARAAQFQSTLQQIPRLWLEFLAVSGLATLILSMLAHGRDMASFVPTLGVFAAAAFRLMPSVNRVLTAVQNLRYSLPAIDTLNEEILLEIPAVAPSRTDAQPFSREIELRGVTFRYPGSAKPALSDVCLNIAKGDSIGMVGASGSGKSTLIDVVLGLLSPSSGEVLVDGRDIQQDLRSWQDQVGYVPQSIYLTDDTLRRNVAFGIPEHQINDAAVSRAIAAAQLGQFVAALAEGWNTVVGERGVRLSGGQRQRIGIARALYHDPQVLVLDEATSALDTETEAGVMEAVRALEGEKTVLIVAHRLSTVEHCTNVIKLEDGRIGRTEVVHDTREPLRRRSIAS